MNSFDNNNHDKEDDELGESFIPEQALPDEYFLSAQRELKNLFEADKDNVFYIRQLQVKFEKKYFHWITYNALMQLHKNLRNLREIVISKAKGTQAHFFTHYSNRYPKRKVKIISELIDEYSQDHITRSCGHRAEDLFCLALVKKGFSIEKQKVKQYNGKEWIKTNHDLDFVFKKDGINYGCEIKNTLGYI